jgi:rod shape-determining protein MreC
MTESRMSKRSYYFAFALVLLVALVLLNLPDRTALRVKVAVGALYLPLFGLTATLQGLTDQATSNLIPRSTLLRQLESLQQEHRQLQLRLAQLEEAQLENDRLRQALDWQPRVPWRVQAARVVGHDPANWWQSLHINRGSRDQLQPHSTVLTAQGLVGRVAEVGFNRSRVVLVGDPTCRIAAQVRETREKGILLPNPSSLDRHVVDFTYLPATASVKAGHTVITSGDGGLFPHGIPVGTVVEVRTNDFGLYLEAQVRVHVNLNRLDEVWILMP